MSVEKVLQNNVILLLQNYGYNLTVFLFSVIVYKYVHKIFYHLINLYSDYVKVQEISNFRINIQNVNLTYLNLQTDLLQSIKSFYFSNKTLLINKIKEMMKTQFSRCLSVCLFLFNNIITAIIIIIIIVLFIRSFVLCTNNFVKKLILSLFLSHLTDIATLDCYYNYNHYSEGDRILTNEPCLNCTCHNKMLMCYLKVCPFTKPIGQDCTIEKREDQCCPIITCPEGMPIDETLITLIEQKK